MTTIDASVAAVATAPAAAPYASPVSAEPVTPGPRPAYVAPLDMSRVFADALAVYRTNFWTLLLAGFVAEVLSLLTLFVMAGPLMGGWCVMSLGALARPDRKADFGLLFGAGTRFLPLVALFFVTTVAQLAGLMLFVIPGLLLMTVWLFPFHLMVDRGLGVGESLRVSWAVVRRRGFGPNLMVAGLVLLLNVVPIFIPYLGWVLSWGLTPLGWLLVTAAYVQQVREDAAGLEEMVGQGFAVVMPGQPVAGRAPV